MKLYLFSILLAFSSLLFNSCTDSSENENAPEKENSRTEAPKSTKGNWTEQDARKFMNDVSKSMKSFREIFGDEKADAVLECYLNKAILTFENYEEAEADTEKCKELANECVEDVLDPEKYYEELAEEAISEEKLKEVAGEIEDLIDERHLKK